MARTAGSRRPAQTLAKRLKRAGITGLGLIIPLVVTILVLLFVWGFIASLINPVSTRLAEYLGLNSEAERYVLLGLTTLGLAIVIVIMGFVANSTDGSHLEDTFDGIISSIPGVGAVYTSFNEMSQMLLDNDTQSFQEVVMVEYPAQGSYCVAFLTAETPAFVREAVGEDEMISVFMPMGPNPFMGGFPLHISTDRVYEIDMTVEEGVRSIVTSGVAMGEDDVPEGTTALDHGSPGSVGNGYGTIRDEDTPDSSTDGDRS